MTTDKTDTMTTTAYSVFKRVEEDQKRVEDDMDDIEAPVTLGESEIALIGAGLSILQAEKAHDECWVSDWCFVLFREYPDLDDLGTAPKRLYVIHNTVCLYSKKRAERRSAAKHMVAKANALGGEKELQMGELNTLIQVFDFVNQFSRNQLVYIGI